FFFSSRRRHTRFSRDWSSDVCSSDLDLTQDKLDEAGRNLAELSTRRREAQGQLNTLDDYRADYTRRLQNTTEQGVTASNYHNFKIGRASCRERGEICVVAGGVRKERR